MIKGFTVAVLLFVVACKEKSPVEKLKSYVEDPDNKITQRITVGDVVVVTRFLPASYRSLMNEEKDTMPGNEDRFYYFDVKFNKNPADKPAKEKLLYLNFDMQNDFVLWVNNRDSIAPSICQKIENGTAGSYEYMVVFERGDAAWKSFTLFYHDKIFNIGTLSFVYNEKDILKIPGIKEKKSE